METLTARLVREGPLPEADAVGWAVRVARAVEPMHERLGEHGRISADAFVIEADACSSEGHLVDFAELPVNPAYHSPERTRGEGASQADDTWALAVTLYFALSGNLPFSGSSPEEVRRKVTSVPAPPLAVFDVGDDRLQEIVDRALASNLAERTTTLAELRRQLEGWLAATAHINADALPPLLSADDNEDEVTMIQVGPPSSLLRKQLDAALAAAAAASAPPPSSAPPPPASAPSASPPPSQPAPAPPSAPPSRASAAPPSQSAPPPASAAPASAARASTAPASAAPTAPASRTANLTAAALGILLGLAGIAFFLWHKDPGDVQGTAPPPSAATSPPPASPTSPASVSKPAHAPSAPPSVAPASVSASTSAPDASVSASASAPQASVSASPSALPASTSKPAAPPGDLASCITPMFPPESFPPAADFAFVCAEPDPLKGAADVRARLVSARKNESEGMQEWALLGWYELAAFSAIRARCCASPPPLKMAEVPKSCAPVPEVLASIDRAVAKATSASDDDLQKAVDAYTHDVYCIVRTGVAARFGRVDRPQGGEDTAFKRFLERVIKAKR